MAKKDIKFTLDTIDSRYSPVGTVKQLDSVFFYIKITENGVTKDLTGQTIKLFAIKEDKKIVEQTTKINITNQSEGLVEIELLNAAIQVHGFTYFELEISDSNGIISTADFILRVNKRVGSPEAIESTNEVSTLKKVEAYVSKAKVELEEFKKVQNEILSTNGEINTQEALRVDAEAKRTEAERIRIKNDKERDEKIIEIEKNNFFKVNRVNLYDPNSVTEGYLNAGGTITPNSNFVTSDFINIKPNIKYYTTEITSGAKAFYYNSMKERLIEATKIEDIITVPNNPDIAYIRLSGIKGENKMFSESDTILEYTPYDKIDILIDERLKEPIKELNDNYFIEDYINLITKEGVLNGKYINKSNGNVASNAGYKASGFIPVISKEIYISNAIYNFGACYNSNREYLCNIESGCVVDNKTILVNREDIAYIRVSYEVSNEPYLILGTKEPSLIPITEKKIYIKDEAIKGQLIDLFKKTDLSNLKWNVLGDSITHAPGKSRNYHSIIGEEENILVRNYGVSGSRISLGHGGTPGNEFCTRFEKMSDDADIITVFGGINDANNKLPVGNFEDREKTTLYGAMHILCQGLHKKYIGKRLGFITPLNYGNAEHKPYIDCIKEVCSYYSIPCLDMWSNGLVITHIQEIMEELCPDGLHPNEKGHDIIARKVKQFLYTL
ncbi:SGNH/GDSL hydrolase family protein [Clostridium perfringens]